ncbi:MAG: hypothetical protein HN553_02350 [Opitutae bacterium]|nr:hypothetical protein [Opitutae bacterium]
MGRKSLKSQLSLIALMLFPFFTNGELATKKSLLFFFDKIEIKGNVDVFLVKGKRSREVTLFADSEIIDSVYTKVKSKTLYIDANNTYSLARRIPFIRINAERKYPVEIIVSVDSLKEIRLLENANLTVKELSTEKVSFFSESSGKLHIEDIAASQLNVIHTGSGDIVLKGKNLREINAKVSGNGNLIASDLDVIRATLTHQGTGVVHLAPSTWLDARMLNNGNLFLHATPSNLVIDQQGTGKVKDILPEAKAIYEVNATKPALQN